jgi:uncharacterized protein (UPF0128 family)
MEIGGTMTQNQIIDLLKERPRTNDELPYRVCLNTLSMMARKSIRRIRVSGRSTHTAGCGRFRTAYYLEGDDTQAVKVFVEANAEALKSLDLSRYTALDSGLTKELAQKVRAIL